MTAGYGPTAYDRLTFHDAVAAFRDGVDDPRAGALSLLGGSNIRRSLLDPRCAGDRPAVDGDRGHAALRAAHRLQRRRRLPDGHCKLDDADAGRRPMARRRHGKGETA